jgi:glycosyltransferase involved in cell wall biosynthesis
MIKISVVVPVYNAAAYVRQAVESAVNLEAVGEVLLIEDKSPDNALEICKQLQAEFPKVKLYQHPNGENRGAGPSRNLGIEKSSFDFIAFLDADDYYLPNRFIEDVELLESQSVDGVYNAASYLIDSEYAFNNVSARYKVKDPIAYLYTVREPIAQPDLFYYLLKGGKGHFHTNTITVRKSVFARTGYFASMKLHQDNHMFLRVALLCNLVPGNTKRATVMIRVHVNNRIRNSSRKTTSEYYDQLYMDLAGSQLPIREYTMLVKKKIGSKSRIAKSRLYNLPFRVFFLILHFVKYPRDIIRCSIADLISHEK